ncbi:zinc transporter, ZIP family [Modicisalibacter ilicicola DSM 19980]|uniref:Zinc transporter, ZIP family n=2 Tax=Modicisalibacter ilicicola TaxID=480814 RepID=A0A1M5A2U3_9GAMM|nr:ZIP family metal transporter [Halomonas ilicicola]SHF24571.1 zinc transporter, ZIP family [Halomonas ilicicola DSM 19980]
MLAPGLVPGAMLSNERKGRVMRVVVKDSRMGWRLPLLGSIIVLLIVGWLVVPVPALLLWLGTLDTMQAGMLASLVAGLFTPVGALPVLLLKRISQRTEDTLMGFGAGVMLAATAFSLAKPAVEEAERLSGAMFPALLIVMMGIAVGSFLIMAIERWLPHEHFMIGKRSGADAAKMRRIWLFVFAITIHNLPEGLAVGVGYGTGDINAGLALTLGIGLQNLPEGLIVALGLIAVGYGRGVAFGLAFLSGLVEPIGGAFGAVAVALAETLLPWGLAFAAGAMLFVISHEIIPESHRQGHERYATMGVLGGFTLMLMLDSIL